MVESSVQKSAWEHIWLLKDEATNLCAQSSSFHNNHDNVFLISYLDGSDFSIAAFVWKHLDLKSRCE